ncbi:ImmA/IrrE family metallo-endopeptidase [Xanthobacteraceae bacterium A53D]
MPQVNPVILRWARETAGFSLEDAAERVGLGAARGVAGADRLRALEEGSGEPSRPLLLRISQQYRRPLVTFFLADPPQAATRGEDFRTLPAEFARRDAALVDALLREVRARQEMVRSLLETEDEARILPFVDSRRIEDGAAALADDIQRHLSFSLEGFRRSNAGANGAFSYLRDCVERTGVFVLLIGDLGNYRSALDVELYRGFALADPIAPMIVINDQDSRAAWSFTLLHELAHIWIGRSGVSGTNSSSIVEQFCNDVAGRILIPAADVQAEAALSGADFDFVLDRIRDLADRWRVSRSAVAYKLFREAIIDRDVWMRSVAIFRQQWIRERQDRREQAREGESGPSYYVVRRHRLGARLIDLSARMLAEGALSPTKAAKILGVKPGNVFTLTGGAAGSPGRAA